MDVVIVTGMSGAGRSTAAHVLEDHQWYVVDNLPASMLFPLVDELRSERKKVAVVIDVRSKEFTTELSAGVSALRANGDNVRILFLDSHDEVLVRRYESTRRPHPLQGDDRIVDGIARERDLLRNLRADAEIVIDSSALNVHQLALKVDQTFTSENERALHLSILSFGYKYGIPYDADFILDCRFIPNPHWVPALQPLSGKEKAVSDAVLSHEATEDFISGFISLFNSASTGFLREGKRYITVAFGCTGGRHRSVAVAHEVARRCKDAGIDVHLQDRDVDR
ncbi:MAG: RNase adapter RapZ [Actinobacteria bacterium]|uniref:RNase adapter RapZ n=1 Tax=Candidatus Fonsibacter lacus TaxID=2576439 RepID=A0A965GBJ3_9PROT|nr:RNase adapter RapZ [Candidatus Fonsibacter lacus]